MSFKFAILVIALNACCLQFAWGQEAAWQSDPIDDVETQNSETAVAPAAKATERNVEAETKFKSEVQDVIDPDGESQRKVPEPGPATNDSLGGRSAPRHIAASKAKHQAKKHLAKRNSKHGTLAHKGKSQKNVTAKHSKKSANTKTAHHKAKKASRSVASSKSARSKKKTFAKRHNPKRQSADL
jgi:hypothetical protein